jgi:hypothetical protein
MADAKIADARPRCGAGWVAGTAGRGEKPARKRCGRLATYTVATSWCGEDRTHLFCRAHGEEVDRREQERKRQEREEEAAELRAAEQEVRLLDVYAAAPDLLAACCFVLDVDGGVLSDDVVEMVSAAIAKARGGR